MVRVRRGGERGRPFYGRGAGFVNRMAQAPPARVVLRCYPLQVRRRRRVAGARRRPEGGGPVAGPLCGTLHFEHSLSKIKDADPTKLLSASSVIKGANGHEGRVAADEYPR